MKKPFKEEKTDLNKEKKVISFFLILFFSYTQLYSQIPINGFCNYKSYEIEKGFNSVFTLNYNNDSYTDLLFFNPRNKNAVLYSGDKSNGFIKDKSISLPYEITNIQSLFDVTNKIKGYVFTSRKNRLAGSFEFTDNDQTKLLSKINFGSYPENLNIGNINNRNDNEILISGSAFDGFSILSLNKNKLDVLSSTSKTSYSDAIFIDLNSNGYKDIAAFNLMNNSIDLLFNNTRGEFKKNREINIPGKISNLNSVDLDLDFNEDLIFISDYSIQILYGDYSSTYDTSLSVNTIYKPDNFITGDFNNDGKIDIAYLNLDEGIVSILFNKNKFEFHPEIIYLKKSGIKKIVPYYTKFIEGIIALNENGNFYSISGLNNFNDNVSITAGADPLAINYLDFNKDGIIDICYIDGFNNSLNLIVRNSSGIPAVFYKRQLHKPHNKIHIINQSSGDKTFYCYTAGEKLVEVIIFNSKENKFSKRTFYSNDNISDLKIIPVKDDNNKIYIAGINENNFRLSVYQFKDFRYTVKNFFTINKKISDVTIGLDGGLSAYYWLSKEDTLHLFKSTVTKKTDRSKKLFSTELKDSFNLISFTGDLLNNGTETFAGFINLKGKDIFLVSSKNFNNKIVNRKFNIKNKNNIYIGELKNNDLKKITYYNYEDHSLNKINFINNGKKITVTKLLDNIDVKDYYIKNLNSKFYHLVYIDQKENCITIKKLP